LSLKDVCHSERSEESASRRRHTAPKRKPTQKPLATSAPGLSTLLAHLLLRYLPRRLRPLPLLMPPVMKRLICQLFLHLSILIYLNGDPSERAPRRRCHAERSETVRRTISRSRSIPAAPQKGERATSTLSFRAPFFWREESAFLILDHEARRRGNITDFIQEERSTLSCLKPAEPPLRRAGECSLLMPEKLGSDQ
jgi:hypothetical protein